MVAHAFTGSGLSQLRGPIVALLAVVLARAAVAWGAELAAGRASALAKTQLRGALLRRVAELGPARIGAERTGALDDAWRHAGSTRWTTTSRCICPRSCSR